MLALFAGNVSGQNMAAVKATVMFDLIARTERDPRVPSSQIGMPSFVVFSPQGDLLRAYSFVPEFFYEDPFKSEREVLLAKGALPSRDEFVSVGTAVAALIVLACAAVAAMSLRDTRLTALLHRDSF